MSLILIRVIVPHRVIVQHRAVARAKVDRLEATRIAAATAERVRRLTLTPVVMQELKVQLTTEIQQATAQARETEKMNPSSPPKGLEMATQLLKPPPPMAI